MVDVLDPKGENELAEDRNLSPTKPPSSASSSPPTPPVTQQESPIPDQQEEGIPAADQGMSQEFYEDFLPQPAPLQFEPVPQPGYRGDLINSINPQGEIEEELLQAQAQQGRDSFLLGLEGLQTTPERLVDPFDWSQGRPIDEIRDTLDVPHYAGLNAQGLSFLPGSGEVKSSSDSVSSDLAIASEGAKSELGRQFQNNFDPELKFNTSRRILDLFSIPIKALTGVDLQELASPEFYKTKATDEERRLIDKYRAENAAPLIFVNKVLDRLERQYVDNRLAAGRESVAKGIEPRKLNFNLWEGNFGDFGNAGLLSAATYALNLPENIIMAAAGEIVEAFNENIPGRERNRFLEALTGRDMGIFEQRTSDFKIFSILPPEGLEHGVETSAYEEATGRTIQSVIANLWDSPEFFQEQYGVSEQLAKLPFWTVAGAGLLASASVDDVFWKPLKVAKNLLRGDIAPELLDAELRRLSKVGIVPDAPDFLKPYSTNAAPTKVAEVQPQALLPPGTDAPTKEMVTDYISQKFGADHVPPVLHEELGRFQVLEWKDKTAPETVIRITDTTRETPSLDLYVRKVDDREIGEAVQPIAEESGRLSVRSSDARTETVVLLERGEEVAPELEPMVSTEAIKSSHVDKLEEFEELRHAPATSENLARAANLKQQLDTSGLSEAAVIKAESLAPESKPSAILEELERNPVHKVADKDVNIVRRTNAELTWVGKNHINPDTNKPYINPNRTTPLTDAQIHDIYRNGGTQLRRFGAVIDPRLPFATHVELEPGRVRRLRRAQDFIEPMTMNSEVLKKPTFNDYNRVKVAHDNVSASSPNDINKLIARAETQKKLATIEASMESSELYKVKKEFHYPERLTADTDLGTQLSSLQRDAKVTRDEIRYLQEEMDKVGRVEEKAYVQLDKVRNYARGDLGADMASARHFEESTGTIDVDTAKNTEALPDLINIQDMSQPTQVLFGTSSPADLRRISLDELEANELGLGLFGTLSEDLATATALRSRPLNAIPMGTGKPKIHLANTSKISFIDGAQPTTKEVKQALKEAIAELGMKHTVRHRKSLANTLSNLKGALKKKINISEKQYRELIDTFQRKLQAQGIGGMVVSNNYVVWDIEKLAPMGITNLGEPSYTSAKLFSYEYDSFMDGFLRTPTTSANKAQSFYDLTKAEFDDIAQLLTQETKKSAELNKEIIDIKRRLKADYRLHKRKTIDVVTGEVTSDFDSVRHTMDTDYPDPC